MSQQPISHHGSNDPLNALFLSPRVIDRTAFEQFTSQLNDLINKAQDGQSSLDHASMNANAVEERLHQAGVELELKAERIAGLIPSIDERLDQIESILEETVSRASNPSQIQAQVERLIAGRLDSLDEELEEMFRHASANAEGSETSSVLRRDDTEEQNAVRIAQLEAQLAAMESKMASLVGESTRPSPAQIESLSAQAYEARDLLGAALLSASARVDTLNDQSEEVITILDACIARAREETSTIRAERDDCKTSALASIDQLEDIASDASQRLSMMLAALVEREKAARDLARDLGELIATMHGLRSGDETAEGVGG
jgi:ABC-type transporter Mla subunit MlaD